MNIKFKWQTGDRSQPQEILTAALGVVKRI